MQQRGHGRKQDPFGKKVSNTLPSSSDTKKRVSVFRSKVIWAFVLILGAWFVFFNVYVVTTKAITIDAEKPPFRQTTTLPTLPPIVRDTSCIPRPPDLQAIVDKRTRPLILYWGTFWGDQWGTFDDVMYKRFSETGSHNVSIPPCFECDATIDESRMSEADIVVFHMPDVGSRVPRKSCGQYFALMSVEAPPYYDDFKRQNSLKQERGRELLSVMDISMNYRLDSDIPIPHFVFWYEEHFKKALLKPVRVPTSKRNSEKPVAWIASKCETDNNRIEYVKELATYIGVASYGKCFHTADFTTGGKSYDDEASRTTASHKFYLSFENSNCEYYVTEKLTRTLELGVIPIIMGAPETRDYLPNDHTGINVADFESPAELAKFLHRINDNDTLFESYLAYKDGDISKEFSDRWFTRHRHRACKLCDIAMNKVPRDQLKGWQFDFSCQGDASKNRRIRGAGQ